MEENLRQSFRALAAARPKGATPELPGVTIASLGVRFQMFNAAFFSASVEGGADLAHRLDIARAHFATEGRAWSLWICEDWLSWTARRRLSRDCLARGLRITAELPGMIAATLPPPRHAMPKLEVRRLASQSDLEAFRAIGANCFRVPPHWFAEVFDETVLTNPGFECWLGFRDGEPVATAATVPSPGAIGLYNIATAPLHQGQGIAEAITRQVVAETQTRLGALPIILQATSQGLRLYERLGFRTVTRILAYVSD